MGKRDVVIADQQHVPWDRETVRTKSIASTKRHLVIRGEDRLKVNPLPYQPLDRASAALTGVVTFNLLVCLGSDRRGHQRGSVSMQFVL